MFCILSKFCFYFSVIRFHFHLQLFISLNVSFASRYSLLAELLMFFSAIFHFKYICVFQRRAAVINIFPEIKWVQWLDHAQLLRNMRWQAVCFEHFFDIKRTSNLTKILIHGHVFVSRASSSFFASVSSPKCDIVSLQVDSPLPDYITSTNDQNYSQVSWDELLETWMNCWMRSQYF